MRFAGIGALGALFLYVAAADTAKPVVPKKSAVPASHHRVTSAKHRKTSSGKSTAAAWRSRQLAPTPERYKEIQSALAQRGYLKKDATGVWDGDSADAMRRFQQDQSLDPSGKVNSLSLIALGMGAKHGNTPPPVTTPVPRSGAPQTPGPSAPTSTPPPSAGRP